MKQKSIKFKKVVDLLDNEQRTLKIQYSDKKKTATAFRVQKTLFICISMLYQQQLTVATQLKTAIII